MTMELKILNPNKYNYKINDYHILLSFLNDKEYKKNTYNKNMKHFKNENEEIMPLTYGTREEPLRPKVYGSEFIFNNSLFRVLISGNIRLQMGWLIYVLRFQKSLRFPFLVIFSGLYLHKKQDLLPLKLFKGFQLYIILNEFAFFVSCINATIKELII